MHLLLQVSWLVEKTIEETTETKDKNPETIEVRVIENEWNWRLQRGAWHLMPQEGLNPWHPDLMKGALTTELPRQPQ